MKNIPLLLGTITATLLLIVGISVFFSKSSEPQVVDQSVLVNNAISAKGPESAKVTIVEFSDFQCPSCKAVEPLVKQVLAKYPNDVRLIYRQFPLTQIHPHSERAAQTALAAGALGKFWEMHAVLFDNQENWSELSDTAAFDSWVDGELTKLSIDKKVFREKIQDKSLKDSINTDVADGSKLNVDATPTFFVNGQKIPAQDLLKIVDDLVQ